MAQGTPAIYTVQPRDSLFSIAQRFYGDGNKYHQIYDYCNRQVIGPDPNVIRPGEVLYISAIAPVVKTCTVTSSTGLRHRAAPTSQSAEVGQASNQGDVLTFFEVVNGESVLGNHLWGHSDQGYYFWLGGTDHPNG